MKKHEVHVSFHEINLLNLNLLGNILILPLNTIYTIIYVNQVNNCILLILHHLSY